MHRFFRLVGVFSVAALAMPLWRVWAQNAPPIERLEVDLWPEYDRAAVLVIYHIRLADGTPLPASVSVPIPSGVGQPLAVAKLAPDGTLLDASYTRQAEGDWANISLETDSLQAQVEYYDTLAIDGQTRRFAYTWPGGVALGSLVYVVQQPVGASGLNVVPAPAQQQSGAYGLTYYLGDLGPQPAPAKETIEVTYTRATSELSATMLQSASPLSPPPAAQGGTLDLTRLLPWLVGGVGLVLLSAGGFIYFRSRRPSGGEARRRHRAERGGSAPEGEGIDAARVFCHHCGAPAGVTDLFCRRCGTRLRS